MVGLIHADPGVSLSHPEYVGIASHTITSGVVGDMLYFDGSEVARLPATTNGFVLMLSAGVPTWTSLGSVPISGDLDMAGNLILNIGANGTDFTAGGGLNLAQGLAVAAGGVVVTAGGLSVLASGISVTGNSTITGTLGGLTGLTVASGGAAISGNSTITGTLGGVTTLTVTTISAHALSGNIDMSTNIITNIGNAGTDFLSNGGLTLANAFTVTTGGATITAGNLGIGTAANAAIGVRVAPAGTLTSASQYGITGEAVFSSAATTSGAAIYANLATIAASFTMTSGYGILVATPSKGATSIITNAYGIRVQAQTAGGTNNYGIYIEASSGGATNNLGLYNAGTTTLVGAVNTTAGLTVGNALTVTAGGATITAGNLGIGAAALGNVGIYIAGTSLSGTSQFGVYPNPTFSSAATVQGAVFYGQVVTAAAAFTMTNAYGTYVSNASIGAGSTITNLYGVYIAAQSGASTTNIGLYNAGTTTLVGQVNTTANIIVGTTLTVTGQILAGDGTAALPSYSFANDSNTGLYSSAADALSVTLGTAESVRFLSGAVRLGASTAVAWSAGATPNTSADLTIVRDAANTFAQRNGGSAQKARWYNTFTTVTTVGEWFETDWITTANTLLLRTNAGSSTGVVRDMIIGPATAVQTNIAGAALTLVGGSALSGVANGGSITLTPGLASGATNGTVVVSRGGLQVTAGNAAIGTTVNASIGLNITGAILSDVAGGTLVQVGISSFATISSAAAADQGGAIFARLVTQNAAFTLASGYGLYIDTPTKGAASTITNAYGAFINVQTQGGTNNYGLYVNGASGGSGANVGIYVNTGGLVVANGNVVLAGAALATTATTGFTFIPTCAGVPTGVIANPTGTVAMVFDTTNNKLMIYDGGWIGIAMI